MRKPEPRRLVEVSQQYVGLRGGVPNSQIRIQEVCSSSRFVLKVVELR
jgi:hypothetical protein